jgi:hypothetical protein
MMPRPPQDAPRVAETEERLRVRTRRAFHGHHYGPGPLDVPVGATGSVRARDWAVARPRGSNLRLSGPVHVRFDDGQVATCIYTSDLELLDDAS